MLRIDARTTGGASGIGRSHAGTSVGPTATAFGERDCAPANVGQSGDGGSGFHSRADCQESFERRDVWPLLAAKLAGGVGMQAAEHVELQCGAVELAGADRGEDQPGADVGQIELAYRDRRANRAGSCAIASGVRFPASWRSGRCRAALARATCRRDRAAAG